MNKIHKRALYARCIAVCLLGLIAIPAEAETLVGDGSGATNLQGPAGFGSASNIQSTSLGIGSVASGVQSSAYGSGSTASGSGGSAFGLFSVASGDLSSAYGSDSEATGDFSAAFGFESNASGDFATAIGSTSDASGNFSTAVGSAASASGVNSTALGVSSSATGVGSTALGVSSSATGISSTALGSSSSATGTGSTALGPASQATADSSVALGQGSIADQANTVSVGAAGAERRITNVAAGVNSTDAVNVSQLQGVVSESVACCAQTLTSANSYTDQQVSLGVERANRYTDVRFAQSIGYTDARTNELNSRLARYRNNSYGGIAAVAAMATTMRDPQPGKMTVNIGAGIFATQAAVAATVAYKSRSSRVRYSAAVAQPVSAGIGPVGAVGVGWEFF